MSEVIISQLDRAFANPLETNRQVNFISDRDAISALRRWEGMQVYVKSELTTYELRGGILNTHWTDISGIDSANYTPTGGYAGTAQDIVDSIQTVTGGIENISITHIANLDYYVIADPYIISGNSYSAAPTTVTLTVGDATNARIDVIYADVNGLIGVLAGTPSVTPVKPIVSNTQRELTFRTVPALATVDPLVTNIVVFNENVGTASGEFDVDGWNLTALDFNSTAVAFSGTKSIYFDGVDPYFNIDFKNDVNIPIAGFSTFFFRIYVTEVLDKNASLFFHILDTSFIANGNYLTVKSGVYGFDRNVLNVWQIISIPVSAFNLTITEIKGIRFMVSSIKKPKMYMDTITFQSNVSQPTLDLSPYELLSNKKTDVETNKTSNTFYASIKSIVDWVTGLFVKGSGTVDYLPKFGVGGKVVGDSSVSETTTDVSTTKGLAFNSTLKSTALSMLLSDSAGNIFRGVRAASAWADNADARWFQIGGSLDNVVFSSFLGTLINRTFFRTSYFKIDSSINSPVPKANISFEVVGNGLFSGSSQVGDNTAAASALNVGAQRYRVSGNNSYVDVCMQVGASSYQWINVVQNNWI